MEKKQTACEWPIEQLTILDITNISDEQWFGIIGQAKQLEKQQIVDAHSTVLSKNCPFMDDWQVLKQAEQYYNKTYNPTEPF